ncbi:MAG: mechanosensitive ion channel domain-containing protein [Candidatus Zixiibacteriota bacterium]|jgi:small-conductance mechanosensitive channel
METLRTIMGEIGRIIEHPIVHVNQRPLTIMSIVLGIVILLVFVLISKGLRKLLKTRLFDKYELDEGIQLVILKLTHYLLVGLGVIIAVQFIGLNLTSLAVVFGLLSVGIGFGLQNVASNFVSGLIILFERPIKIGDRITIGDVWGDVVNISLRATLIRTVDNIAIIVPNSEFISSQVINWSHRDPKVRVHIPVGVAYGSDVPLVIKSLLETAENHPEVMKDPPPKVWFSEFGDSSLNFELLVWTLDPKKRLDVISKLNRGIDDIFRKNKIQIPFPQRDLHVRSSVPIRAFTGNQNESNQET